MTEYWKSQARKYCEFCKCWFADNKVSITFHENGKRHKESVQKHISQLTKKSAKEFKQKEKVDDEMKKMEAAAMAAYLLDVQNNADLTSQNINEMLQESGSSSSNLTVGGAPSHNIPNPIKPAVVTPPPVWHEVKTEDGSYFWNIQTNETTWDPPDEYLSLSQQAEQDLKKKETQKKKEKLKKQQQKESVEEVRAHMAREQMRELAVNKTPETPTPPPRDVTPATSYGPAPRAQKPYGAWTTVNNQPDEKIDLQLPKSEKEPPPPPVVMEPEVVQFKEKRVQSLGDGPVEFKKRKVNNNRRNMRQKLDDE